MRSIRPGVKNQLQEWNCKNFTMKTGLGCKGDDSGLGGWGLGFVYQTICIIKSGLSRCCAGKV